MDDLEQADLDEEVKPNPGQPNELIEFIATNLVKSPEDVKVENTISNGCYDLFLTVNDSEIGSVIGKNGRVAKALRVLINSMSLENFIDEDDEVVRRTNLEIVDNKK